MKRLLSLALALLLLAALPLSLTSCEETLPDDSEFALSEAETDFVAIFVKGYGAIVVELYPDVAPITVQNFKKLVKEEFYDGTVFHRVIENFMIQTGESANGEEADMIRGEFALNGIKNDLKHERGVISMARYNDPYYNTASSQFFIVHKTSPHLDGSYAAFGRVLEGMDVVDEIATVKTNDNDRPVKKVKVETISFVAKKAAE